MYKLNEIKEIHLETTSKCQARCPMCPRRLNGGSINPLITLDEIYLDDFKKWFPVHFLQNLDRLFMCGNLGDPVVAQDTLEIFQYLREINPDIQLSMHTNGSARTKDWWHKLALADVEVTFGIDGLEDTHSLYRINTDWATIIKNAQSFIDAGGKANWHMLVFKHNEHQIENCKQLSLEYGFKYFSIKHTSRFKENKLHVIDDAGKTAYKIYPTQKSLDMIPKVTQFYTDQSPCIKCKAKQQKQIYVSANGNIAPCCWLDMQYKLHIQDTRIDYMDKIEQFPNLREMSIEDIFSSDYFKSIEKTWADDPLLECSKQCGSFDKLQEQFVES